MIEGLNKRERGLVINSLIDAFEWSQAVSSILEWAILNQSRYVCICNVHSIITATNNDAFKRTLNQADMATPDGFPVAWMLRKLGYPNQERISGPDLMWKLCERCANEKLSVYFYGSTEKTLNLMKEKFLSSFPNLQIAGIESPPFRDLSEQEDFDAVERINNSGAGIVFVGLGCPKQEIWMSEHRGRVNAVMIGVGAAFDFYAGTVKRAPEWMQKNGLEWLYRLCSEPRRLWKRYLVTNTLFVIYASKQLGGLWN